MNDELRNEAKTATAKIPTLGMSIVRLSEISWDIHSRLFGQQTTPERPNPVESTENIISFRNVIDEITDRLTECRDSLKSLS